MAQSAAEMWSPPYQPGNILVDYCEPFLKSLRYPYSGNRCSNCFEEKTTIILCDGCFMTTYCSEHCRDIDGKNGHEVECRLFKNEKLRNYCQKNDSFYTSFMLRFYALKSMRHDLYRKQFRMLDGSSRGKRNSESKNGQHERVRQMLMLTSVTMNKLLKEADKKNQFLDGEIHELLRIVHTDKIYLMSEDESTIIGFGIYVQLNGIPHSCKPTAQYLNQGTRIQLRAIAPIQVGHVPTIGHVLSASPKADRQNYLREVFDIECTCQTCQSGSDSGVDFVWLNALFEEMRQLRFKKGKSEWTQIWRVHQETLTILMQLFHEYDRRVTDWFWTTLVVAMESKVDKGDLKKLLDETSERMQVTFGPNQEHHEMFKFQTADYR